MEDDNGLELSLGLSFGGSAGKSKSRDINSDHKIDEGSSSKVVSGNVADVSLKNFFQTNTEKQDQKGKQSISQPRENFWRDLSRAPFPVSDDFANIQSNQLQFMRYQESFIANSRTTNNEEEKSGSKKRRLPSEEINFQKKHAPLVDHSETACKGPSVDPFVKAPNISASMDDGCSGENEDVAESEAEGSNSWLVSQHEDSSKQSDLPKVIDKSASSGMSRPGRKQQIYVGKESNLENDKVPFCIPMSFQPVTVMTMPYSVPVEVPPATSMPSNTAAFSSPGAMQLMPIASNEGQMVQAVNANSLQLAFGYAAVHLPRLETNSSWAFSSLPQHVSSAAMKNHADGVPDSGSAELHGRIPRSSASALAFEGKSTSAVKGSGKHAMDGGPSSSSQAEDEGKGTNPLFRQKDVGIAGEGSTLKGSQIRPGVAPNVNFGGCGSYPDLPWVSTTGSGPNARTISGVTYKYSENQVKIVCACHGSHMSPEEFVQHASSKAIDSENNSTFVSFATTNPAASA